MKPHIFVLSLLLTFFGAVVCKADNYVIINQVMYDTPLNEKTSVTPYSNGEFIELYNAGSHDTISLQGWWIKGDGVSEVYHFPDIQLPAAHYLILACRRGAGNTFQMSDLYTLPNDSNYAILYQNKILLANGGETLTLCNAQNDTVDQMYYDGTSHLSNPDRLYASNEDGISGDSCVSLHRVAVSFDPDGKAIREPDQWQTDRISYAASFLPQSSYSEYYITGNQSLPAGENYILSVTPLDPTSRISIQDGKVSVCDNVRVLSNLQYADGIGRTDETIALGVTPDKQDLVSVVDYHGKRNVSRQWLPVVLETDGQHMDAITIHDRCKTFYSDTLPFSETFYENSAIARPVSAVKPGNTYHNHYAAYTYSMNSSSDNVRVFSVNANGSLCTSGSNYNEATLYKNTDTDEDGISNIVYTDKQQRTIMIERNSSRTYYVYDDLGRLRFVLPNLSSSKLNNGIYNLEDPTLKAIAYCYRYDGRGNVIYKRLPGCEPQYMVYDLLGQVVLRQDSIQRRDKMWIMCAYDSIGRNLYTAEVRLAQNHDDCIAYFADKWQVEHFDSNSFNTVKGTGYTMSLLNTDSIRMLTVSYYDDYAFLSTFPAAVGSALHFEHESSYGEPHDNAVGLPTGTRIYNLSEDGYTATANYYDAKGRVVQSRSVRSSDGYKTVTDNKYMFDGSIAQQLTTQGTGSNLVREHYRYTYDHVGRAKQVCYQLNNDSEIILSENSYDNTGRLVQNLLCNKQDTILYSYDMRNMLTETRNRHFTERLFYADSLPQYATVCRNGNIAALRIEQMDSVFTFAYTYDACNRLKTSNRLTGYGAMFSESFDYDDAGNISSLKRYMDSRLVDDLSYHYGTDGNQVLSITDSGADADQYYVAEYHNAETAADTTMRYDANGNLIFDAGRGISAIRYNILNLPDTIQFSNGNQIVNLYDAAGRKYRSVTYTLPATAVTPIYEIAHYNFSTDTIHFDVTEYTGNIERRYSRTDTTQRVFNTIGYYTDSTYYHYIKDHLGNICAVVNSMADTTIQSTIYYASGVPMVQSWGKDRQPYLYNGKEFIEAHDYNTYDYGFRGYYATIGRFTSVDPLTEQTPWQSPYTYANNNPINNIDWMGLSGMMSGYTSTYGWMAQDKDGNVVDWGEDNNDWHVYEVDDDWDGTYEGLQGHSCIIGWEIFDKYGKKQNYVVGKPAYYLGSITKVEYVLGHVYVIGSTALMCGKKTVDKEIDDTVSAMWHYFVGFGHEIALGNYFTRHALLTNPVFLSMRDKILTGEKSAVGSFKIDMTDYMFHIGNTTINYYSTATYSVFSLGTEDGFWDVIVCLEKSETHPNGFIPPDGDGWLLECGIPYHYIPLTIMIPNNISLK